MNAVHRMMDTEAAFEKIRDEIKNENYSAVRPSVESILNSDSVDVYTAIKCASLLKTIDDETGCQEVIDRALTMVPEDADSRYDIAIAIRGLGRAEEAVDLIEDLKLDKEKGPEVARTLMMAGESEEALCVMEKLGCKSVEDRLLLCDIYCDLGEFQKAFEEAETVVSEDGESYRSLVNICTVMFKMGRDKDAVKFAKAHLKDDKKNADSLALQAYVMWINGKIPAAANYANRALHIDLMHIGALEVMAMCLIEKKKYPQAKLLAGAINEKEPGNPAVIRILDACRISSE